MTEKYLAPALSVAATLFLCVCLAIGGCAEKRAGALGAVDGGDGGAARSGASRIRIGEDCGTIGTLEAVANVKATVYGADGTVAENADVELSPGTWLVPASAIARPSAVCGEGL